MARNTKKSKTDGRWYDVTREHIGLDYDPAKINAEKYRDVMPRGEGYYKDYDIGKEPPPEGHVDDTPHGRSILDRRQVLKPVEVDEDDNILDGFDRRLVARRHGIPCPLVMVRGLKEEQKRDYILEVNTARRDLDPRVRADLARYYLVREEDDFKSGKVRYRSTFNKVAVLHGLTLRKVRQLERANFPDRWKAACKGETRVSQNDRTFEVKETDPDSQIQGLLGKLGEDTPLDQQEAAILLLREILERHGDVLGGKDRKEIRDKVDAADQRVRQMRAAEERSRADAARASLTRGSDAGGGGEEQSGGPGADEQEVAAAAPADWFGRFRAELQEEIEALEDTVLSLREWSGREDHPLSAALLRVLIAEELISVEEDQGVEVVRVDEPDLVAALAAAETALDPIFRKLGVTPEIAARHLLAMVREGRGLIPDEPPTADPI